jgi:hypothetical protein
MENLLLMLKDFSPEALKYLVDELAEDLQAIPCAWGWA